MEPTAGRLRLEMGILHHPLIILTFVGAYNFVRQEKAYGDVDVHIGIGVPIPPPPPL